MWIRVRVEFSPETTAILNILKEHKENLKSIHAENVVLKKLCFFGNEIQKEAQKKLNKNKFTIKCQEDAVKTYTKIFREQYEADYKKSYDQAVKFFKKHKSKHVDESTSSMASPIKASKPEHPIVYQLKSVLKTAEQTNVKLGATLNEKIQERIVKLG